MQRLSLCIDIDGTITDPYYWIPRASKYFGKEIIPEEVTCYEMYLALGVEEREFEEFHSVYEATLYKEAKIRGDVCEVISELHKTHYIHFVTAREETMEFVSVDWLNRHRIPYDSISLLGTPDKVQMAGELESDLFIEDRYENALQLAEAGFEVLLIDCSYNQGPILPNITRVSNWQQIKSIILRHAEKEAS